MSHPADALLAALDAAEAAPDCPVEMPAAPTPATCTIFTGQGMRVVLPELVAVELCRRGFIEAPLTRVLLHTLRPGMTFVDVGGHYGYHSLVASLLVGPTGAVVALEPGRAVARLLRENTAGAPNVTVHEVAAAARDEPVTLRDFGPCHSALSTLRSDARTPPAERRRLRAETYPVPGVTLDRFLLDAGVRPDVVKLDAEGAELDILTGMRRLLDEVGPLLTVEAGDYEGMAAPATADCLDYLEALGYRAAEWSGDGLRPHRRRPRYDYDNLFFVKG